MDALWSRTASMTVRDVLEVLHRDRPLAYTTVMTVLDNLHRKGWLRRERDGRAWRYTAVMSRDAYTADMMSHMLAGSPDPGRRGWRSRGGNSRRSPSCWRPF